ncbi:MAG: NAD(P)-dependent oxidoreductase [Chloroflexi bacterium]|nr:NAD(P)-dependent oxidoreductase [Chloroflexota bacterium]
MQTRVGFIGIGKMGNPMCRHLLAAGFPLTVFDLQPEATRTLATLGARETKSPREVAQNSDVMLVMVTDDAAVRAVGTELIEGARAGAVIAICSSVHPDTCRDLARVAAEKNIGVVDAPVARGQRGAEAGELTVFFGGKSSDVEICKPVFAAFSKTQFHMGAVGAGQITKTCNNLLHWSGVVACYETLTLGARFGIAPADLRAAMLAGSADSRTLRELHLIGMYWPHKDMETALELADANEMPVPLMREVNELVTKISAQDLRTLFEKND